MGGVWVGDVVSVVGWVAGEGVRGHQCGVLQVSGRCVCFYLRIFSIPFRRP